MNINYSYNALNVAINENEENKIPLIKHSPCVNTDEKLGRAITQIYHFLDSRARILVQVTIYRRLLIGRDGHLDQSEAYDIS